MGWDRLEHELARRGSSVKTSGAITRRALAWVALASWLLILVFGWKPFLRYHYNRERANWKAWALPHLVRQSVTNEEMRDEFEALKAGPGDEKFFVWARKNIVMMTNGEYLVYAFRHGFNSGFVDHLFLARGSNGHWYYSTYHFCMDMAGILGSGDRQPGSISEFAGRYSVREFDGKSDECLRHTWPQEP
jgi:hypothetical protein